MYSSQAFGIFYRVGQPSPLSILEHFHRCKKKLKPVGSQSPFTLWSRRPMATTDQLFGSVHLPIAYCPHFM